MCGLSMCVGFGSEGREIVIKLTLAKGRKEQKKEQQKPAEPHN